MLQLSQIKIETSVEDRIGKLRVQDCEAGEECLLSFSKKTTFDRKAMVKKMNKNKRKTSRKLWLHELSKLV